MEKGRGKIQKGKDRDGERIRVPFLDIYLKYQIIFPEKMPVTELDM